jgi:hypothetical protein
MNKVVFCSLTSTRVDSDLLGIHDRCRVLRDLGLCSSPDRALGWVGGRRGVCNSPLAHVHYVDTGAIREPVRRSFLDEGVYEGRTTNLLAGLRCFG